MATKTTLSFGCFFCTMLEICMSKQRRPKLQISSCYQYSSVIYKHRHYSNIFLNSLTSISRIAFFRFINLFSKICNQHRPKHPPNAHYSRRPSFRSLKTSMKLWKYQWRSRLTLVFVNKLEERFFCMKKLESKPGRRETSSFSPSSSASEGRFTNMGFR